MEFLGHKVNDGGLMMDEAKIKFIRDWEAPTKVTELRWFLGLVNYYRCQEAFKELKEAVMQEHIMRLSNVTKPFDLDTDASDFTI